MVCVHIILSSENGIQIRVAVNRQILLTKGQPAQSLLMNKTFQQQNKPISIYVENICGNGLVLLSERFVHIPILLSSCVEKARSRSRRESWYFGCSDERELA